MRKLYYGFIFIFVFLLISCSPNIDKVIEAVQLNDSNLLSLLLEKGAPVESEKLFIQPLEIAVENNSTSIIKLLLENGANPNLIDSKGHSLLVNLVKDNNIEIISIFVQFGVNCDQIINEDKESLLYWAVINENVELSRLLVEKGADVNLVTPGNEYPILEMAIYYMPIPIFQLMLDSNANIEIKDKNNRGPLSYAVSRSKKEKALLLIEYGANIREPGYKGTSPWIELISNWVDGFEEIGQKYLSSGYQIDLSLPLLQEAIKDNNFKAVKWLLENGVDPDKKYFDEWGWYQEMPIYEALEKQYDLTHKAGKDAGYEPDELHIEENSKIIELLKQYIDGKVDY